MVGKRKDVVFVAPPGGMVDSGSSRFFLSMGEGKASNICNRMFFVLESKREIEGKFGCVY